MLFDSIILFITVYEHLTNKSTFLTFWKENALQFINVLELIEQVTSQQLMGDLKDVKKYHNFLVSNLLSYPVIRDFIKIGGVNWKSGSDNANTVVFTKPSFWFCLKKMLFLLHN